MLTVYFYYIISTMFKLHKYAGSLCKQSNVNIIVTLPRSGWSAKINLKASPELSRLFNPVTIATDVVQVGVFRHFSYISTLFDRLFYVSVVFRKKKVKKLYLLFYLLVQLLLHLASAFLFGVCMFSQCMCEFSVGTRVHFHGPNIRMLG